MVSLNCETSNIESFDGYCTYSLLISKEGGEEANGLVKIINNSVEQDYPFDIQSGMFYYFINFNLFKNDKVLIEFETITLASFSVYNKGNIEGYSDNLNNVNGDIILESNIAVIYLINECLLSECIYEIHKTCPFWDSSRIIRVYVNDLLQAGYFDGDPYTYSVHQSDSIRYELEGGKIVDISAETVDTDNPSTAVSTWYPKLYFTPAQVPNNCPNSTIKSPFGGSLVILTTEEIKLFCSKNLSPFISNRIFLTVSA